MCLCEDFAHVISQLQHVCVLVGWEPLSTHRRGSEFLCRVHSEGQGEASRVLRHLDVVFL